MYRTDNSTNTASIPTPGAVGPNPDGFYQDTAPGGGTIVDADHLNAMQEELAYIVTNNGDTLSKTDRTQVDKAIRDIAAEGSPYLHVRDEKATQTDGGTFTSGSWQTRTLNTVKTNDITGASLSSNQITLPAGTYLIQALATANQVHEHKAILYNTTDASDEVIGTSENANTSVEMTTNSFVNGEFTIAGSKVFELRHRCVSTQATNGYGNAQKAYSGPVEVYADVQIWKVG